MSAVDCRKPSPTGTCIESLAAGWIGVPDLCPTCTAAFMTAMDGIGRPLDWHQAYRDRAER